MLAFDLASLYIWDVTSSPKCFFKRLLALCKEILFSNMWIQSLGGQLEGQHKGAICFTSVLYLSRHVDSGLKLMSYKSVIDLWRYVGVRSLLI